MANTNFTNISTGFFTYSFHYKKEAILSSLNQFPSPILTLNKANYNIHKDVFPYHFPTSYIDQYLIDLYCNDYSISLKDELILLNDKLQSHYKGFIKGISTGIKSNAIKTAYLYSPFIRLSNITLSFLYTHFVLIELFDGSFEFLVSEEIPDYNIDLTSVLSYTESAFKQIRRSSFSSSSYHYGSKNDTNTIYTNYILTNLIYENFHIKIDLSTSKLIVTSNDPLQDYHNIKKTHEIQFGKYYHIYKISKLGTLKNYNSYAITCYEKIYFYIAFICLDNYIIRQLKKKKEPSLLEQKQLNIALNSISIMKKEYKLLISDEIECLIKDNKSNLKWQLYHNTTAPLYEAIINKMSK